MSTRTPRHMGAASRARRLLIAAVIGASACGSTAGASTPDAARVFEDGNRAYAEGRFDQAVDRYQEANELAGLSPSLLYDLGNAYYRVGNIAQAVVCYERALKLAPRDADIQANLAMVRKEAGLFRDPVPAWRRPFVDASLNEWLALAGVGFSLISAMTLLRGLGLGGAGNSAKRMLRIHRAAVACGAAMLLTGVAGALVRYPETHDAVVIEASAPLQVSPFDGADSAALLPAGKIVRVRKTRGDYAYVHDPSGRAGWMHSRLIEPIWPRADHGSG